MATTGNTYLNLADVFKQTNENGDIGDIIELLAATNPILADMIVDECNDGTSNLTTVRTGLPSGTWRRLYGGVQPSKSTNRQVRDATGMLEAWSEIDAKLLKLSGNPNKLRLNEAAAFLEGMSQDMATTLFYGDTDTHPDRFMGLASRFDAYRATRNIPSADVYDQVVDGGGRGNDNTSVWIVVWGERTVHGLYPKGTRAGLQRKDLGEETKELNDGSVYRVVREQFMWDLGLSVRDYRYVVRIANIDTSELLAGTVDIYGLLRKGFYRLKQRQVTGGRAAIYANSDVVEAMDAASTPTISTAGTAPIRLRPMELDGFEVMAYRGIPVRETDALLNTEAAIPEYVAE